MPRPPTILPRLIRAASTKAATPKPPPLVFTRESLAAVRSALLPPPTTPIAELPKHTATFGDGRKIKTPSDAAVLIPLCNVGGVATILMHVRAATLRVHANEAGFPGGKAETADENMVEAALRETEEELDLPPSHVEILGSMEPEYSLGNRARVWPIIGFIHSGDAFMEATNNAIESASDPSTDKSPLDSLSLSSLRPDAGEVAALLPLPLSAVADPARQGAHYFRMDGKRPYWKLRCGDFIIPPPEEPVQLDVWGLSGWFLSRFAIRMKWTDVPPVSLPPTDD